MTENAADIIDICIHLEMHAHVHHTMFINTFIVFSCIAVLLLLLKCYCFSTTVTICKLN